MKRKVRSKISKLTLFLFCLLAGAFSVSAQDEIKAKEVKFNKGSDVIAGTLLLPAGKAPYPAVVFLHGSEAGSRKMPHYRRAAENLLKAGIAVLITDKRGVGDSTGVYVETPDLKVAAEDAAAKVEYLAGRKEINSKQIGVMGWSQGGWVGPLAAEMSPKIAFVITVSGPGVSVQEQVIYQRGQELLDAGYTPQEVEEIAVFRRKLWTYYGTGAGFEEMRKIFEREKNKSWFARFASDNSMRLYEPSALSSPQFQFFRNLLYDPEPVLARLKVPLLAIFGEKDRLIPVTESVEKMRTIFARSGHRDVTIRVFPNAGHGIQLIESEPEKLVPGGGHKPPAKPPIPAPGYWELVVEWIKNRAVAKQNKSHKKSQQKS
jgi:uncharacterized protein